MLRSHLIDLRLKNDVFDDQTAFSDEKEEILHDSWSGGSFTKKVNFDLKSQTLIKIVKDATEEF